MRPLTLMAASGFSQVAPKEAPGCRAVRRDLLLASEAQKETQGLPIQPHPDLQTSGELTRFPPGAYDMSTQPAISTQADALLHSLGLHRELEFLRGFSRQRVSSLLALLARLGICVSTSCL